MNSVLVGKIYRHYKGKNYRVISTAKHSETLEDYVVYETLYENDLGKIWIRPMKMFCEQVEINGKFIPRFELIQSL